MWPTLGITVLYFSCRKLSRSVPEREMKFCFIKQEEKCNINVRHFDEHELNGTNIYKFGSAH
jgi:hypothetical protein